MSGTSLSRRNFIARGLQLPLAAGVAWLQIGCGRSAQPAQCVDPAELTAGERSFRVSLRYTETSQHASQRCSGCAFFTAGNDSSCGTCKMLGGPVSANGRCDSWSARTGKGAA